MGKKDKALQHSNEDNFGQWIKEKFLEEGREILEETEKQPDDTVLLSKAEEDALFKRICQAAEKKGLIKPDNPKE